MNNSIKTKLHLHFVNLTHSLACEQALYFEVARRKVARERASDEESSERTRERVAKPWMVEKKIRACNDH